MDLGYVPLNVENALKGVEYLMFEANYDVEMETNSQRPAYLVDRIMGRYGHLSNDQAAAALKRLVTCQTKEVVLVHLSVDCNTPHIAVNTVHDKLKGLGHNFSIKAAPAKGVGAFGRGATYKL